jgi:hypothetical protein
MTMTSYVIYGFTDQPLEELVPAIEAALGIKFVVHESLYRGLYYRSIQSCKESFLLQRNYLPARNEWVDGKYSNFPILLYADETMRPDEVDRLLRERIPSIQQLHRRDYSDDDGVA